MANFLRMGLKRLLVIAACRTIFITAQLPYAYIDVSNDAGQTYSISYFVQPASFGPLPPEGAVPRTALTLPTSASADEFGFGCGPITELEPLPSNTPQALFISRGNCSFVRKALNAQAAGAAAVFIYDGIPGKYWASMANSSSGNAPRQLQAGQCDVDCSAGSGSVPAAAVTLQQAYTGYPGQCGSGSGCASGLCALTSDPPLDAAGTRRVCCIPDDYMFMGSGGAGSGDDGNAVKIPTVFVTAGDGVALMKMLQVRSVQKLEENGTSRLLSASSGASTTYGASVAAAGDSGQHSDACGARESASALNLHREPASMSLHQAVFGILHGSRSQQQHQRRLSSREDPLSPSSVSPPLASESTSSDTLPHHHQQHQQQQQLSSDAPVVVFTRLAMRPMSTWDTAGIFLWLLGSVVVALATWVSATEERARYKLRVAGREGLPAPVVHHIHAVPGAAPMNLTLRQSLYLLSFSCILLLSLYFLVKLSPFAVVYLMIFMFCMGALNSVALILFMPILDRVAPQLEMHTLVTIPRIGPVNAAYAVSYSVSFSLIVTWIVTRHSDWAYILQDGFGICLCCMFLLQLRLSTLKTCATALSAFFCYDIFMVFITPYLFGSSVMIDVATAGQPQPVANQACYCRLNPTDVLTCGPGERMPILLMLPRMNDWRGGYSMLGLGDIVIPGLLLSYCLRWDYDSARGLGARGANGLDNNAGGAVVAMMMKGKLMGYWPVAVIGYVLGLACANMAVSLMQMGQPALLYLVPCTLIPVMMLAHSRGELPAMWQGRSVRLGSDDYDGGIGETGEAHTGETGIMVDSDDDEAVPLALRMDQAGAGPAMGNYTMVQMPPANNNSGADPGHVGSDVSSAAAAALGIDRAESSASVEGAQHGHGAAA